MTAPEFLLTICEELAISVPSGSVGSLKDLVDILSRHLLGAHAAGNRVVLVVDEAQNLAAEVLEQVRLLTNLETNTQKLLQIILIGQPELRDLLAGHDLRQLAQRITGRYHLSPLTRDETAAYVRHRLRVAGSTSDIFSPAALAEIYRLSRGVPRVINVICDRALLGCYTMDRHRVTAPLVREAASEVLGRRVTPPWLPWAATAGTVLATGLVGFTLWNSAPWADSPAASRTQRSGSISSAALTAAASTSASAAAKAPAVPLEHLGPLLASHNAETDTDSAFGKLFALWGLRYVPGRTDPCTQATKQGLECVSQRGSFGQLRLFNRPAILMLNDDGGASHQVVLTALDDEHARVALGDARPQIGLGELSRYWFGDFVMLWRPGTPGVKPLSPGMRGADVRWLRVNLRKLAGEHPAGPVSDVFDDDLGRLVKDFQRQHRLTVDGIAGVLTQIAVASAVSGSDAPLLADTHGG
jgi:general secretion pathway protein A